VLDLLKQLKAYKKIKVTELKKIIATIITQYRKINEPPFQTGLNTRTLVGPTVHHYHKWLLEIIRWTLETKQDHISRNLWPKIKVPEDVEMTTMSMHQTVSNELHLGE
jgi:hypothetical protein